MVKAVVLMLLYSLLSTVIGLIPQMFSFSSGEDALLGGYYLYLTGAYSIVAAIVVALNFVRIGLFIALAVKALNEKSITIPAVDKLIDKYMDKE